MTGWPADNVERRQIADLLPRAGNPRLHPDWQIAQISESMKEWGWTIPILIDEEGNIIAGHGRIFAAQRNGYVEAPCMVARGWTDTKKRAYVIADNQLALNATWDYQMLSAELTEIESFTELVGFSAKDIARINRNDNPDLFDSVPNAPTDPVTKAGDVWALGRHRLMCGNASDVDHMKRLCGDRMIDLIVTSPPYNQDIQSFEPSGQMKEAPGFVKRMASSYFDSMPEPDYRQWQVELFTLMREFMSPTGAVFYNHKIRYRDKQILHPMEWVPLFPFRIRQEIVWDRSSSMTLNARMFIPADERLYWLTCSDDFYFSDETDHKAFTSVWKIAPVNDVKVSAAFAREIPLRAIAACSPDGAIVADPFAGTGTTMIAAEQLNRPCLSMELDPRYVDVAVQRWETFTGLKAEREPHHG